MTNKKKAKEIGTAIWKEWKDSALSVGAEDGANLMAEWKDAQFKEYLEKKLESVRVEIDKCSKNTVKEYSLVMVREYLDEIINELFGG